MMDAKNENERRAMCAIRAKLYAVNSYYAYQDFKRANPNGRRYDKRGNPIDYNPYSLSPLTNEAREYYSMAMGLSWDKEQESRIKGYLMSLRLSGDLEKILAWEENTPGRAQKNPWKEAGK